MKEGLVDSIGTHEQLMKKSEEYGMIWGGESERGE